MSKNTIRKEAFKKCKTRFNGIILSLSFFVLIFIPCFAIAFFYPETLILTVPFVMIPSFFAIGSVNIVADKPNMKTERVFFRMFRNYYSPFFKGGYKVWIGFLKSLLVFVIVGSVIATVFEYTVLINDPLFTSLLDSLASETNLGNIYDDLLVCITENKYFELMTYLISLLGVFGGLYMFIHHIGMNQIKFYFNLLGVTPLPARDLNITYKETFKKIKKQLRKDYYSSCWFLIILIPVFYFAGSLLTYFFIPNIEVFESVIIGFVCVLLIGACFIPYYLNCLELIYLKHAVTFTETFVDLSLKSIEEIKKRETIDPEKEKAIKEFLNAQKEIIDKKEEEKKTEEKDK